jgi:hypothetical protein
MQTTDGDTELHDLDTYAQDTYTAYYSPLNDEKEAPEDEEPAPAIVRSKGCTAFLERLPLWLKLVIM